MNRIKNCLKTCVLTRSLYSWLRDVKDYKTRRIRKNMKLKGVETIFFIESILSENAFFYMDMGTLLGIIREGRLLGHDLDIDVAVYVQNEAEKMQLKDLLLNAGCQLRYSYRVESIGVVEQSFEFNDLKFDINYYVREGEQDVCYLMYRDTEKTYQNENEMSVVKLAVTAVDRVKRVPFGGREVTVPNDPERYLAERYGENWRIPDKGYVYWKGPSARLTDYTGYQEKES